MSVRVRSNFSGINRAFDRLNDRGLYILANQALADSNNYVPELSGDLKRFAIVSNDNKQLIWTQPYARFQYYANRQFNYTKPGTGPKWVEVAKQRHINAWIKAAGREFK